jgi:hypothetical protein
VRASASADPMTGHHDRDMRHLWWLITAAITATVLAGAAGAALPTP